MVPAYPRRSKPISDRAAFADLKDNSERDVSSVLEVVPGEGAKKPSASVLSELRKAWTGEFTEWQDRDLSSVRFTYPFAVGIHQEIRGDNPRICVQALMGVDNKGRKNLIAHRTKPENPPRVGTRCCWAPKPED